MTLLIQKLCIVAFVCLRIVRATIPDCSAVPTNISYVKEDCLNATHRRVQSGKCVNGALDEELVSIVNCKEYSPIADVALSTAIDFYCHECQDRRVVCSELEATPQACAAHVNDDTFCRQVESIASFSGCISFSDYYTAIEYCTSDRQGDASITSHSCSDEGAGSSRCMSCKDGLRVCAATNAVECEEIGLPSTSGSNSSDGLGGGDSAFDESEDFKSFDCNQFWGDVQFYGEECFNTTHRVITTGVCIGGQVQGLSFQTTPCSSDGEEIRYCHDCHGKAVCADTPIISNVCDDKDEITPCSSLFDRSSHWAGCKDEISFTVGSDSCRGGSELLSQQTLRCGDQFQGFPHCIFQESNNYQLCSAVPLLPSPPVQCDDTEESDILWSKFECFNNTHTLYRSGRCINGELRGPVAKVEPCKGYCHQCSDSTAVCSLSERSDIACVPQSDGASCEIQGLVSFTEGCVDQEKSFRETKTCSSDGQIETDRSEQICSARYYDTPKCLACNLASFCAAEDATCASFGAKPATTNPGPRPGTEDGIACPEMNVNVNYYKESCYNSTHVRLLQGECEKGNKAKSESILVSCTDYGENEERKYCHECGGSVSCSNVVGTDQACERRYHDKTCDAAVSDLSGVFGCLDQNVFFTDFATCSSGTYSSEMNGFRCADAFPGHEYCNTCKSLNICSSEKKSCFELGF